MANNNEKKLNGTVIVTYRCNARFDSFLLRKLK